MRREARLEYERAGYPAVDGALDRRTVLAGLGALAGATAVGGLAGCVTQGGLVEGPDDGHTVRLPLEDQTRELYMDQGHIEYHLDVTVADLDRALYLQAHVGTLLDLVDSALLPQGIDAFAPDASFGAIEETLRHVLADDYAGEQGAPVDGWYDVALVIDVYDREEEMLGDVAEAR